MMLIGQRLWCWPDLIQDFSKKKSVTKPDWSIYPHPIRISGGVTRPSRQAARSAILTSSRSNNYHSYLHSKTLRSSKVWRTTRKCLQHSRLWQGWRQHLRVKYMKHKSTNAGNSASLQMTMNTSFSRARARPDIGSATCLTIWIGFWGLQERFSTIQLCSTYIYAFFAH